jgi:hypothetical protein
MNVVSILTNTIFLPQNAMLAATEFIREDALRSDLDPDAINSMCDYWRDCINDHTKFGAR